MDKLFKIDNCGKLLTSRNVQAQGVFISKSNAYLDAHDIPLVKKN